MPGWIVTFFPPFSPSEFRAYVRYETDSTQNEILSLASEQIQAWQFPAVSSTASLSLHGPVWQRVEITGLAGAPAC